MSQFLDAQDETGHRDVRLWGKDPSSGKVPPFYISTDGGGGGNKNFDPEVLYKYELLIYTF